MELYKPFWNIYRISVRVKKNKEQCPHVNERLDALEKLVEFLKQEEVHQVPKDMNEALGKLNEVLKQAEVLIKKFNKEHMLNHMVKSTDYREEFDNLNKSLTDAYVTLSSALHVYQGQKLVKQEIRLTEQEEKLAKQERRLAEQKNTLEEQEDILQRIETMYDTKAFYCILQ